MRYSSRTPPLHALEPNALARAREARRSAGQTVLDLTTSNPTAVGLVNTPGLAAIDANAAHLYAPDARGLGSARDAVAGYYRDAFQAHVDPARRLVLTASTSEAYGVLLRLLCEHGDEVLVPSPSYPLLDALVMLEGVSSRAYPLHYESGWSLDLVALARAITPRTRAVVVVHPNNPTGHFVSATEAERLLALCRTHNLALISDEVFADSTAQIPGDAAPVPLATACDDVPVFSLGGLSKTCALPQVKLGWFVVGEHPELAETMARLEFVNDALLSANAPTMLAAGGILATRSEIQRRIAERVQTNLATVHHIHTNASVWNPLDRDAGWSLVLRVPATVTGVQWAEALLVQRGVYVHPGEFFGFGAGPSHLVLSLLSVPSVFSEGLQELDDFLRSATS